MDGRELHPLVGVVPERARRAGMADRHCLILVVDHSKAGAGALEHIDEGARGSEIEHAGFVDNAGGCSRRHVAVRVHDRRRRRRTGVVTPGGAQKPWVQCGCQCCRPHHGAQ